MTSKIFSALIFAGIITLRTVEAAITASTTTTATFTTSTTMASYNADLPPLPPGEEIYDIKPLISIPYPWLSTILSVLLAAIALWLIYLFFKWLLAPIPRTKKILKPIDPLQEALKALERLRTSPLWEPSRIKDVCEHIALILKVYLKNKFNIGPGKSATTD